MAVEEMRFGRRYGLDSISLHCYLRMEFQRSNQYANKVLEEGN